jgi:hypothetical protein
MFIGLDTAAKTMVTATVLGAVVAVATNYGMKAFDHIKAKRNEKKNQNLQTN